MDFLLGPLYYVVSWIMIGWHWFFERALGIGHNGATWTLSIIGLVLVIRVLLIPLFVRQIKSQRKMQLLQPQLREIQKKYKGDRERLQRETMQLYKDTGTNPFASCLPILLQAPVLFALFRVLDGIAKDMPRGAFQNHPALFHSVANAEVFGVKITDSFLTTDDPLTKVVAVVMIVIMVVTQFITQRQIMRKNMPKESLEGPFAQQQKILLYVLPLVFAFSGVYFPLGTVLYWLTSNIWTMGQQLYVIRRMPAPGTDAERAHRKRLEEKARRKGVPVPSSSDEGDGKDAPPVGGSPAGGSPSGGSAGGSAASRQQPKRTTRSQRKPNKK